MVLDCEINDKKGLLNRFEKQIAPMSTLTDLWWKWVDCDLSNKQCEKEMKEWIKYYLLPYVYWGQQIKKSKASKPLKELYKSMQKTAEEKLKKHSLTTNTLIAAWIGWAKYICSKYQRTTSAIEGRNGMLSGYNHDTRGMTELQLKSQTVIHNFWITREDGTTAAERLFGFKPPNLFEWLVNNMEEMPLPRRNNKTNKIPNIRKIFIPAIS